MALYIDIEKDTIENTYYRKVIHTTDHNQVVLMSLEPGEDIPMETHNGSQFIRFEKGKGLAIIDGEEYDLRDGISVNIPTGTEHYVKQTGYQPLKLYAVYSPPEHHPGLIQTRQENYIQQLPADVLELTYGYLDDVDLMKACLVNKDFNRKLCNNKAWVRKIMDKYQLSSEEIDRYKRDNTYGAYYMRLNEMVKEYSPDALLIMSIGLNRPELTLIGLRRGGNINGKSTYNRPLSRAVSAAMPEIVKILLDAGADIHYDNEAPLRYALNNIKFKKNQEELLEIIKLLLEAGSDFSNEYIKDKMHNINNQKVIELFKQYGYKN